MTHIETALAAVPGNVGLAVKHLETGREIRHNAETVFFTASTLKVPLLVALYRQVDEGRIDLNHRIELTEDLHAPGSGILREMAPGLRPTLRDLAVLMIIISDNGATDYLYNLVGGKNLNTTMQDLGLTQTRIPMTCRQLLFSAVGLNPDNPEHTLDMCSARLFNYKFDLNAGAYNETKSDVSTPADMCRLLELLYAGNILSPASREDALNILKRQQLKTVLPHALPIGTNVAHKTGYYLGVRADVGIVFSPSGPYTIALMAKNITDRDRMKVDLSLAAVSRAVYDTLAAA